MDANSLTPRRWYFLGLLLVSLWGGDGISALADAAGDTDAPSDRCSEIVAYLGNAVLAPTGEIYERLRRESYDPVERVSALLQAVHPKVLAQLADTVSPDDIRQIFERAQSQGLAGFAPPPTPAEAHFLFDLYQFAFYAGDALWAGTTGEELRKSLLESLEDYRKDFEGVYRTIDPGKALETSLTRTEAGFFERHIFRRQGKYPALLKFAGIPFDGLRRFLFPVHPRVVQILAVHNALRKEIQLTRKVTNVIRSIGVGEADTHHLNASQKREVEWLIAAEDEQIAEVQRFLRSIYGDAVEGGEGLAPERIDLHALAKKVDAFRDQVRTAALLSAQVGRLKRLDAIVWQARSQARLPPRDPQTMPLEEKQVRHLLGQRNVRVAREDHETVLQRATSLSYTVHYKWDETHSRQVLVGYSNGQAQYQTQFYTETYYGSTARSATFAHVLSAKYDQSAPRGTVTRIEGLDKIKAEASRIHEEEGVFWESLSAAESDLLQSIAGWPDKPDIQALDDTRERLARAEVQLERYKLKPKEEVLSVWPHDSFDNFQERNQKLLARYAVVRELLGLYFAQLQTQSSQPLEPTFELPLYQEELESLRREMLRNRWIKGGIAGTGIAAGGAALWWWLGF